MILVPILILLGMTSWAADTTSPQDREAENIMFILDASGSMAQKIANRTKLDIAKEVMSGLVKNLPSGIKVGLTAYGHRNKDDCHDIEELSSLATLDNDAREALLKKIAGMKCLGKTPIAGSITLVADRLKISEQAATIVLVSDGEETCEGDPCALVKDLKAAGVRFVLHVIGFDVNEETKAQLACIAEAGGGKYFGAKNADELLAATHEVVLKTEESSGILNLKAMRDGKPLDAYYTIFTKGEEKTRVTYGRTGQEGSAIKLMPGSYQAEVVNDKDAARPNVKVEGIEIVAAKTVEKVAEFSGGKLTIKAVQDGKPLDAMFSIFTKAGEGENPSRVTYGRTSQNGSSVDLPTGFYTAEVTNDKDAARPTIKIEDIEIKAAATTEKIAEFTGGKLTIKASLNGKPLDAYYSLFVKVEGGETPTRVTYGRTGQNGASLNLPLGSYEAEVTNDKSAARPKVKIEDIDIKAAATTEKIAEFTGGKLTIKASLNGKPLDAYYSLFVKVVGGETPTRVTYGRTGQNGASLDLPLGSYEAEVTNDKDPARPKVKIDVIDIQVAATVEKIASF
jgi:Ca-activated chloride channel family protein